MAEYKIERFSKETVKDLYWLFNVTTKLKTTLSEFESKYNTDFTGVSYIGFMAYDFNNKPAAFYGIIPTVGIVNDKKILIAQSADTRTHPDHQRKGLFVLLAEKTYGLAKDVGIQFIYGVANENSFPGFIKKLNWVHIGDMKVYETSNTMLPIAQLFRYSSRLKKVYQSYVAFILSFYRKTDCISIFNKQANDFIHILKDDNYYNYKNIKSVYLLRLDNQIVWVKFEGVLMIGNLEIKSPQEQRALVKKLKTIAWLTGIKKIKYFTSDNNPEVGLLKDNFKISQGSPIIVLPLNSKYDFSKIVLFNSDIDTF